MLMTASVVGFFRLLFWFVVAMYLFRILSRWLLPWVLKNAMERRKKDFYNGSSRQRPFKKSKEGETTIDKKPPAQKSMSDGLGDYIKYEEIDED